MTRQQTTTVWTDGACVPNPGRGGWAWATEDGLQKGFGHCPRTTNNRMELIAVIQAVKALSGPLLVISDSRYVIDAMTRGWARKWSRRGWDGRLNADLWQELLRLVQTRGHKVEWRWIRGHSEDGMNDLVDRLANKAAMRQEGLPTPVVMAAAPPTRSPAQGRLL